MSNKLAELLGAARTVVIAQADNPDGDSLASSLALEQIIGDMGKEPILYCGVEVPSYLRYLPGWDRVTNQLPNKFDLSLIVDTSSISLFQTAERSGQMPVLASRPAVIIDHHDVKPSIAFAQEVINRRAVATGEVIYELARELDWPVNITAKEMIAISIMADSLGLISEGTTPRSIHIIAELVEQGVSLAALDDARRQTMRKHRSLLAYKGRLLQRIELHDNDRIATITIPWKEIEQFSPLYNPSMLVIDEMRLVENTRIAIAFKVYDDGKVTAKIRANYGNGIAAELAGHFGGGGHPYASGFKVTDGRAAEQVKSQCIGLASELLDKLDREQTDEALQHPAQAS